MKSIIYSVDNVKVMRVKGEVSAYLLVAKGRVSTTGWSKGSLAPYSYAKPPDDGMLD